MIEDRHYGTLVEQLVPCASGWIGIAGSLDFKAHEIAGIQANVMIMIGAPLACLREVLTLWMRWAPGDARETKDVATLEALKAAVTKAGFPKEAGKLTLERREP